MQENLSAVLCYPSTYFPLIAARDTAARGKLVIASNVSQPSALRNQLLPAKGATLVLATSSASSAASWAAALLFRQRKPAATRRFKLT